MEVLNETNYTKALDKLRGLATSDGVLVFGEGANAALEVCCAEDLDVAHEILGAEKIKDGYRLTGAPPEMPVSGQQTILVMIDTRLKPGQWRLTLANDIWTASHLANGNPKWGQVVWHNFRWTEGKDSPQVEAVLREFENAAS